MDFRIVCTSCWKATKYDALDIPDGPCDLCGAKL
jgi:rRNA maturation endonuclease Nob1